MERSGLPTPFIRISGVQPTGYTNNLLTLGALGQGLTQPCKPETQSHCVQASDRFWDADYSSQTKTRAQVPVSPFAAGLLFDEHVLPQGPAIQESRH